MCRVEVTKNSLSKLAGAWSEQGGRALDWAVVAVVSLLRRFVGTVVAVLSQGKRVKCTRLLGAMTDGRY
jgi:hypothetical protein